MKKKERKTKKKKENRNKIFLRNKKLFKFHISQNWNFVRLTVH